MTTRSDITLIGGGIIGLLTARELHLAGASVTLIEKNRIGQESSWAGGGILLPLYPWRQPLAISHLIMQSLKLYPTLTEQLRTQTQIDPEWTPCGMLITHNPDYQHATEWCAQFGVACQNAPVALFDSLNVKPDNPLWLPDIAQARNPRLVKSLKQDLLNKNVRLIEQCEVTMPVIDNNRVVAIDTSQGRFAVQELVISAGAWSGRLFRQFFPHGTAWLPQISPVKGQMLLFDAQPSLLNYMVLTEDQYLIPRRDGKILAGSTVEQQQFDKTTSTEAHDRIKAFAVDLMPGLADFPVTHHWAGLRPGTAHGIPYIDRHPEIMNLYINAGHFRNGLAMGPASAQLLADLILQRPPCIAAEPYRFTSPH